MLRRQYFLQLVSECLTITEHMDVFHLSKLFTVDSIPVDIHSTRVYRLFKPILHPIHKSLYFTRL